MKLHFDRALVDGTWADNVTIGIDAHGTISELQTAGKRTDEASHVDGIAIPGFVNAHSHAFQRALAGRTEVRSATADSFWTWRQQMYDFVQRLSAEDLHHIAAWLYAEMLVAGYTSVGEFHYLHHGPGGQPWDDPGTTSTATANAATRAGIRLCLLPVLYQRSGFDRAEPQPHQQRFVHSVESFVQLLENLQRKYENQPLIRIGAAVHSLRAVGLSAIEETLAAIRPPGRELPLHIHVAEQMQEVHDCVAAHGRRPVELLLESFDVDASWCLIHATHITQAEVTAIAEAGCTVCVCPTTEANLGDGFFPAADFRSAGGSLTIGSDSHVSVDPREELRWLEYGERLRRQQRTVLAEPAGSAGATLTRTCLAGGRRAIGTNVGRIAVGAAADIVVLDANHPDLVATHGDTTLDAFLFGPHGSPVRDVFVGGRQVVQNGRHEQSEPLAAAYRETLMRLCG